MGTLSQAQVCASNVLSSSVKAEIENTTSHILQTWKKTVEGIIEVGKGLHHLRELMPYALFSVHIRKRLGVSEMQAGRLIAVYRRFGNASSSRVLGTKISVLYLLASNADPAKVQKLASGGKVRIGGTIKSINELKVEDAIKLKINARHQTHPLTEWEIDLKRAEKAAIEIGTLLQELEDYVVDLQRFIKSGVRVPNRKMLVDTLKETKLTIDSALRLLQ